MAKKKSFRKTRKLFLELKAWAGKHKFWAGIWAVGLLFVLLLTAQMVTERYSYSRVENRLEDLLVTLPHGERSDRKIETERSCGRSSAKSGAGHLRCSVRKKATYQLSEFNNPDQIYPEIYKHLQERDYVEDGLVFSAYDFPAKNINPEKVSNEIISEVRPNFHLSFIENFDCSVVIDLENELVSLASSCTRDAQIEFFELGKP